MSYKTEWLSEGQVLLVKAGQDLTGEDLAQLDNEMLAYLAQAQGEFIHAIYDISAVQSRPNLKSVVTMRYPKHPQMGWQCIIEELNPATTFVAGLAANILNIRFKKIKTAEEAVEFLAQVDPSIDFSNLGQ